MNICIIKLSKINLLIRLPGNHTVQEAQQRQLFPAWKAQRLKPKQFVSLSQDLLFQNQISAFPVVVTLLMLIAHTEECDTIKVPVLNITWLLSFFKSWK